MTDDASGDAVRGEYYHRICCRCGAWYWVARPEAIADHYVFCPACWLTLRGNRWLRYAVATLDVERAAEEENQGRYGQRTPPNGHLRWRER